MNKEKIQTIINEAEYEILAFDRTSKVVSEKLINTLKQLALCNVVKSLPIQDLPNCTRVEVIDQKGRSYVNWKPTNKVRLSLQDDGRTAKIFID